MKSVVAIIVLLAFVLIVGFVIYMESAPGMALTDSVLVGTLIGYLAGLAERIVRDYFRFDESSTDSKDNKPLEAEKPEQERLSR